jgi:hypothetical protein
MATSPTAKEVSVDLSGFKSSVDQQFKCQKAKMLGIGLGHQR